MNRYRSLDLTPLAHEPKDILREVKRLTRQPDYLQEIYKRRFVQYYRKWIGMRTPHDVYQLDELKRDLQMAMHALDAFFFAGSLTRPSRYAWHGVRLLDMQVQDNIFGKGKPGHQVYLDIGLPVISGAACPTVDGRTTIYIDTLQNGSRTMVEIIFETMVHEMAHAIFHSFACRRGDCTRIATRPEILGQIGHGDLWVGMAEHMRDTIQSWDVDLADFYNTDDIRSHNRELN